MLRPVFQSDAVRMASSCILTQACILRVGALDLLLSHLSRRCTLSCKEGCTWRRAIAFLAARKHALVWDAKACEPMRSHIPPPAHRSRSFPGVDYKPTKSLAQVRIFDGDTDHQQDSSLVLWDKRRLGDATKILEQLATRYREELFQFMYGDKVRHCYRSYVFILARTYRPGTCVSNPVRAWVLSEPHLISTTTHKTCNHRPNTDAGTFLDGLRTCRT